MRRFVLIVCGIALCASALDAQQPPAAPAVPTVTGDPRRPAARSRAAAASSPTRRSSSRATGSRDVGPNVRIPAGAQVIDLSTHDGDARPGGRAQPPGAHLQARAREQRLLLHLRPGFDGAARHPGGVEWHADARRPVSPWSATRQQRQLRRHRAASGDRTGVDSRDRRSSTPGSSSAAWAASSSPTPEMAKEHNIVYPGISRRRHARRDRQGRAAEHPVRREGDQDLRRLQAVRLHGRRDPAVRPRGGEGGNEGGRARPDAAGARTRSTPDLVDRALRRAERRDAQADGAERHLARRHGNADWLAGIRCRRRRSSAPSRA